MTTVYWKLTTPGEPTQYGQVTAPRRDKQPLPPGARIISRETYEAELDALARRAEIERRASEQRALDRYTNARQARAEAAEQLHALGLSPTAAAILARHGGTDA